MRVGGSSSTAPASNDDVYSVGMSWLVSMARMTSRTASLPETRTIPRRTASWVAMVDLPTPVAPPINTTSGTSSFSIDCQRRKFFAYRSPARSDSTTTVSSFSCSRVTVSVPSDSRRSSTSSATW